MTNEEILSIENIVKNLDKQPKINDADIDFVIENEDEIKKNQKISLAKALANKQKGEMI